LAFTQNLKYSPKNRLFLSSESNKHFEKLRVAHPHEFLMRIWKKVLRFKINFIKIKINVFLFFCKTIQPGGLPPVHKNDFG